MDLCQENIITPVEPCFKWGFKNLPNDSRKAIKFIVDTLMCSVYPLLKRISHQLHLHYQIKNEISDENVIQIRNVYTLCADQIKKCILTLLDIIKIEYQQGVFLQESRQCTVERICWCTQKLASIQQLLETPSRDMLDASHEFVTVSSMYFVNWVDQTFDILGKLSSVISRNDFKKTEELSTDWKKELIECVCGLHTSIDELLLSAMTLCKYCLPADQYVVKARCQVVLRETKTLLNELIEGDSDTVQATIETLKLPIMPFNINVRIDVLKDVLYVLETNTNTALLALVVHCFSQDVSPVEKLKNHFENSTKTCTCVETGDDSDVAEKCKVIKDFDLYNERLLQIGSFAMSCSSDQKRILNLRSGLASLEALDPHLVPAVMMFPRSPHAGILSTTWREETILIRNSVFLIVDPAAFADKARQMMHQSLLEIMKEDHYDNIKTCTVINIACVVLDFFEVYEEWEPDALTCHEQLAPLLRNLNKVQIECKIVSNLLSASNEHKYDVKITRKTTNPTTQQLVKRLKLLYTLVKRINLLYNPSENDDEFYEEPLENKNFTQTYNKYATYVNSPKKYTQNFSKSVFARTNMRCSTGKFPLAILTKHMKARNNRDLSFSIKLDGLCDDVSELKLNREPSILYHTPLKSKTSLRKVVLCKQRALPYEKRDFNDKTELESNVSEKESVLDDAMSLQITDVLNQINDLTFNASTTTRHTLNSTVVIEKPAKNHDDVTKNVLKLSINNDATFKRVWNISINSSGADNEVASNITQPSEVNTLERIKDLELVESRLSDLKSGHIETSL